ncbi:hypothetical protein FBU30_004789 [Linnemannia zychae]|nr:hypothetical protein FBU30_004789 [Linnemannia zychae]
MATNKGTITSRFLPNPLTVVHNGKQKEQMKANFQYANDGDGCDDGGDGVGGPHIEILEDLDAEDEDLLVDVGVGGVYDDGGGDESDAVHPFHLKQLHDADENEVLVALLFQARWLQQPGHPKVGGSDDDEQDTDVGEDVSENACDHGGENADVAHMVRNLDPYHRGGFHDHYLHTFASVDSNLAL